MSNKLSTDTSKGSPTPQSPCVFVVIAYRYGMRDDHSYFVVVCDSLEDGKQAATQEVSFRSGKYGCEVIECQIGPWAEGRISRQVYYVPSSFEGVLGEGYDQVDKSTEGWEDRREKNIRKQMKYLSLQNQNPKL
jgi:hypothetical protein